MQKIGDYAWPPNCYLQGMDLNYIDQFHVQFKIHEVNIRTKESD